MNLPRTIVAAAQAISAGRLSPVTLVERSLARIAQLDGALQTWAVLNTDGALADARQLADELARGQSRGPLHGIPIGIKDIIDVAGLPTGCASPLRRGHVAEQDATVVARLRAAGAVILGKTVTTEFACFDPPPTRNPWNVGRTPGGSSSGSAAALAAGMCLGALGSQTGGSITRPATYCGVAGCKPTFGRVSRVGVAMISEHLDHVGPMAHSVADLAILLQAIAGPDPRDPWTLPDSPLDYPRTVAEGSPPRIGVLEPFFLDDAEPVVRAATQRAIETLRAQGAHVTSTLLPAGFEQVHARHKTIMAVECYEVHRAAYEATPHQFGPKISSLLVEGRNTSPADYQAALAHQELFKQQFAHTLAGLDVLLCPATTSAAPLPESTGDPRFNSPWSYAGAPTVSFPIALAPDGLPLGLQLVAACGSEVGLFRAAHWCEQRLPFTAEPPLGL